jgi:prolyl-tRNA synthetase
MADKKEKLGVKKEKAEKITVKKAENLSEWYTQIITKTEFIDYTSVSGGYAFRPDGYFAWETVQRATDLLFKEVGIQNVYFPMLIPERLLNKEKEHIKGFSPEVAWVTHAGDSKLEERLAIRPTSETIMYESYAKWIRSWRDLPMRYNQWNSVIRWEFRHPTPLLRTREFLWNEGHTVFASEEEADAERDVVLKIYEMITRDYLALPGIMGKKTNQEKFAGALASYSIEHLLPDGLVIQGPDFHHDGQNFAKAFEITFIDKDGQRKYVHQNTFAISTRELGVMLAVHGDDKGLIIPPRIARIQIVIVPIYNNENMATVLRQTEDLFIKLGTRFRTHVDNRDIYSPGWKFNEWELRGIPVRIELGEKEIKAMDAVVVRRDTGEKIRVRMVEIESKVGELLNDINSSLYAKAKKFLEVNTHHAKNYEELKDIIKGRGGIVQAPWCGSTECEDKIKEESGAKISNMPFDKQDDIKGKKCIYCGNEAKHVANFAKSY